MTKSTTFKLGKIEVPINTKKSEYTPLPSIYIPNSKSDVIIENILLGVKKNLPVLLIGPTGCGKTASIRWLAEQTNNGYRRIQLNGSTNIDSFVGRWLINSEGTYWVDGILTEAMRKGLWLVCDELNAALPEILFVLHSVMDDDKMLIIDEKDGEIVKPHPDFRLFAAMNPSESYVGTKELNRALVDRFPIVLNVDYPNEKQEVAIIVSHSGIDPNLGSIGGREPIVQRMVKLANIIRQKSKEESMIFSCSTRQLIYWAHLAVEIGVKQGAQIALVNKADEEDRKKLLDEINKYFRDDEDSLDFKKFTVKFREDKLVKKLCTDAIETIEKGGVGGVESITTVADAGVKTKKSVEVISTSTPELFRLVKDKGISSSLRIKLLQELLNRWSDLTDLQRKEVVGIPHPKVSGEAAVGVASVSSEKIEKEEISVEDLPF